jgi:hypothetical protein
MLVGEMLPFGIAAPKLASKNTSENIAIKINIFTSFILRFLWCLALVAYQKAKKTPAGVLTSHTNRDLAILGNLRNFNC